MPSDLQQKIDKVIQQFEAEVSRLSDQQRFRKAVVRSRLDCSVVMILDQHSLFVLAQQHFGMAQSSYIYRPEVDFTTEQIMDAAKWEFAFDDAFLVSFPKVL